MKTARTCFMLMVCVILARLPSASSPQDSKAPETFGRFHTWENVGQITNISGKILSIRRTLRISDSSWSLEPGAVAEASQLSSGDQIMARGKTTSDGSFETRRIYMLSPSANHAQAEGGKAVAFGTDHGAPESKVPAGTGYPGDMGTEGRGRTGPYPGGSPAPPSGPGGGGHGSPGGLQAVRGNAPPRFLPGDLEGQIEEVHSDHLVLSQAFVIDKETTIRSGAGPITGKNLKVGQLVAVTIKDEVDSKTRARKATVVRLLP
jgi:uncharacterized protein DUF5666